MDDCIFCKIVKGEMPSTKVYEDSRFVAFMNIYPAAKGHTLIIPKEHIQWMQDGDDTVIGDIFILTKKLMNKIRSELACDYVQITVLGEQVPHFHIHLIPRYKGDGLPSWAAIEYTSSLEMEDIAKKLKQ